MADDRTPPIALRDSPKANIDLLQPLASTSRSQSFQSVASAKDMQSYDQEDEERETFDPFSIDPSYRLRTVTTAHSAIAESIRIEGEAEARKRKRKLFSGFKSGRRGTLSSLRESTWRKGSAGRHDESEDERSRAGSIVAKPVQTPQAPEKEEKVEKTNKKPEGQRRTLYINLPLPTSFLTAKGDPIVRFVRNKVRTSKYTIVTFIPKNLFEQFRRAANIYFLALVIIQLFPIFGAPNAQIGMLPLLAILGMTAIKDAVEDWRRARLDNEVNNSAATKLGGWRNVNQPNDPRSFIEKMLGLNGALCPLHRGGRRASLITSPGQAVERSQEVEEQRGESRPPDRHGKAKGDSERGGACRRCYD